MTDDFTYYNPRIPLDGIEIKNPPFPIALYRTRFELHIECTVPHRDTGELIHVTHQHTLPPAHFKFPFEQWVYTRLQEVFMHELNECFHVNGKRVYDPHGIHKITIHGEVTI